MKGKNLIQENLKSILAIAIHAGFPDGNKDDREREEIRRIAESLAEQAAAKKQKTVFDDQLKALDKAKGVEKQMIEDKERRDKEMEKQENGG